MRRFRLTVAIVLAALAAGATVAQEVTPVRCDALSARRAACLSNAASIKQLMGFGYGGGGQECLDGRGGCALLQH
jgi:hypothetical protein